MGFDPDKIELGVKAEDARLPPPSNKNLQTNTNQTVDPKQHYVPGHVYGGKTFIGPGVDQGVGDPASWK